MGKLAARQIKTAAPVAVGATNSAGTSDSLAAADHAHAHGSHTDPNAHALATDSAHGFMSSTQAKHLEGLKAAVKFTVDLVFTNNVNLSSGAEPTGDFASFTELIIDKVLLAGQTNPAENGVYQALWSTTPDQWTRLAGADTSADFQDTRGWLVHVTQGTRYANTLWMFHLSNELAWSYGGGVITLGTTDLRFACIGGGAFNDNPQPIGAAAVKGTSKVPLPSDHVHAHGNQTDGAMHALATGSANGFMSTTDKKRVDAWAEFYENLPNLMATTDAIAGFPTASGNLDATAYATYEGKPFILAGQTDPIQRGVYVASGGTWARHPDWAAGKVITRRPVFYATLGGLNKNTLWTISGTLPLTIGTSPLVFVQLTASDARGSIAYGAGNIYCGNKRLYAVGEPQAANEAATRNYVDTAVSSVTGAMSVADKRRTDALVLERYRDIVGVSNAIEIFHSRYGIELVAGEVQSWTGQFGGISVPAPSETQRPQYYDSADIGDCPVVRSYSGHRLQSDGEAAQPYIPLSSKPYVIGLLRRVASLSNHASFFHLGYTGGSQSAFALHDDTTDATELTTMVSHQWGASAAQGSMGGAGQFTTHIVEGWIEPDLKAAIRIDGGATVLAVNATSGISGVTPVTRIAIGAWTKPLTYIADAEHALYLLCLSKPDEATCAALRAWIKADFGIA